MDELIPLSAVILSLAIPIVAIICAVIGYIRKKENYTTLRRLLIENHTDLETAKAIMAEQEKKPNKYHSLRSACILIGIGFGALADYLLNVEGIYFWLVIAFGVGIGLLASFITELKLQHQETQQE